MLTQYGLSLGTGNREPRRNAQKFLCQGGDIGGNAQDLQKRQKLYKQNCQNIK